MSSVSLIQTALHTYCHCIIYRYAPGLQMQEGGSQRIVAESGRLEGMEDLGDEKGLSCLVCREGYAFKSDEVLGIYTYRYSIAAGVHDRSHRLSLLCMLIMVS